MLGRKLATLAGVDSDLNDEPPTGVVDFLKVVSIVEKIEPLFIVPRVPGSFR